jgi:mono/diheme cytochrome c family protein
MIRRGLILAGVVLVGLGVLLLFSYDIIKVEWISFMEIQPSFKPMEEPLPPPADSVPIQGAAYLPGQGPPANPVPADEISVSRGEELFSLNCALCHGARGRGDGVVGAALANKPADLMSQRVLMRSDGDMFMTISSGIPDRMPALNENLTVRDRWDVVNYVRAVLQAPE